MGDIIGQTIDIPDSRLTNADVGTYSMKLCSSDGNNDTCVEFNLTVNTNNPPAFSTAPVD